jgi:hypothetical protein
MSKATVTASIKAPPDVERMTVSVLGRVTTDLNGHWPVLIGDSEDTSDPEDVSRFLREMSPDVECGATLTTAPRDTQRRARSGVRTGMARQARRAHIAASASASGFLANSPAKTRDRKDRAPRPRCSAAKRYQSSRS